MTLRRHLLAALLALGALPAKPKLQRCAVCGNALPPYVPTADEVMISTFKGKQAFVTPAAHPWALTGCAKCRVVSLQPAS